MIVHRLGGSNPGGAVRAQGKEMHRRAVKPVKSKVVDLMGQPVLGHPNQPDEVSALSFGLLTLFPFTPHLSFLVALQEVASFVS